MIDNIITQPYSEEMPFGVLAVWFATILLLATGFHRIREKIEYVLMKLYEFFIQRNALKL